MTRLLALLALCCSQALAQYPAKPVRAGDSLTARVKTNFQVPSFATFTVTIIGDQVAKAFNIQA